MLLRLVLTCFPDLPIAGHAGCLTVSLVGLNFQGVIHSQVAIPQSLSSEVTLEGLLSGQGEDGPDDTHSTQQKTTVELMSEVVKTGASLYQCRMLLVLDIYYLGEERLEIVLSRGYHLDGR